MRAVSGFAALALLAGCAPQSRPVQPPPVLVTPTVSTPEVAPDPPKIEPAAAAPAALAPPADVPPPTTLVQQAPRRGSSVLTAPAVAPPAATPAAASTPTPTTPAHGSTDQAVSPPEARPTPGRQQIQDYADWVHRAEAERAAMVQHSTSRGAGLPASFSALLLNPGGSGVNATALNAMRQYLQQVRRTKPTPPLPCTMFDRFYSQWISEQEATTDALAQGMANPTWIANKDARIEGLGVAADQELTKLAAFYGFPKEFKIRY